MYHWRATGGNPSTAAEPPEISPTTTEHANKGQCFSDSHASDEQSRTCADCDASMGKGKISNLCKRFSDDARVTATRLKAKFGTLNGSGFTV